MYYPIFRAKQYELITIRESIQKLKISGKIVPVLEPVKSGKNSLNKMFRCLNELNNEGLDSIFIVNPQLKQGDFYKKVNDLSEFIEKLQSELPHVSYAFWVGDNTCFQDLKDFINNTKGSFYLFHYAEFNEIEEVLEFLKDKKNFVGHFIINELSDQQYLVNAQKKRITLKDNFKRYDANEDYRHEDDHYFSNEYSKFTQNNFDGFSDYLTIGSQYKLGGGTPNTIAIHLTYEAQACIRVKHCLSKNYEVNQDVNAMIKEALDELKDFLDENPQIYEYSNAVHKFMEYRNDLENSTNLATLKKLSMNHHLELICEVLKGDNGAFKKVS